MGQYARPVFLTIAVDFDGVIATYDNGWSEGLITGELMEGAEKALRKLVEKGYQVVIFTARMNKESPMQKPYAMIENWLTAHGMKKGVHWHDITAEKPKAIAYIDDRAIRFTNWRDMLNYF